MNECFIFISSEHSSSVILLLGVTCHYSAAAGAPKKKIQTTLTNLVVKGTDLIIQETQQKLGNFVSQEYISFSGINV